MADWTSFATRLGTYARHDAIAAESVLFGSGINLSSIAFLEFILELEEDLGRDIDVDSLDASIVTAGQLYDRLFPQG